MTTSTMTDDLKTASGSGSDRGGGDDATNAVSRTIGDAAGTVRNLAATSADLAPGAAATARDLIGIADRQMRQSSDEMLAAGATLAAGVALGLFLGGSNRFLVTLAMIPAVAMGVRFLDRSGATGRVRTRA